MQERVEKVARLLAEKHLDALLITEPHNSYYLTGIQEEEVFDLMLLIGQDGASLIAGKWYWDQAEPLKHIELVRVTQDVSQTQALDETIQRLNAMRVGFEGEHVLYGPSICLKPA